MWEERGNSLLTTFKLNIINPFNCFSFTNESRKTKNHLKEHLCFYNHLANLIKDITYLIFLHKLWKNEKSLLKENIYDFSNDLANEIRYISSATS